MKKKSRKFLLCFVISFTIICLTGKSYSQSPMIEMTVNQIVDNFSNRIRDIIADVETTISKAAFDIRQDGSILIDQLDYIADKNIDKLFSELDETQQNLVNDIDLIIKRTEDEGKALLLETDKVLNKTIALAGSLPGGKRRPVVSGVSKSYLSELDFDYPIEVQGAWLGKYKPRARSRRSTESRELGKREPYILLEGEKYRAVTAIDNKLEFDLPFEDFNDSSKINFISTTLVVYEKRKPVHYNIGFYLVPLKMGSYKLYTKTNENRRISSRRSQRFRKRNPHCARDRRIVWTFNAQGPEWKIDVNSVRDRCTNRSRSSSYDGLRNVGPRGFQITATVGNRGDCIGPIRDARGSVSGTVSWTEYRDAPVVSDEGLAAEGELFWGEDVFFDLPENLNTFRLEIRTISGETRIYTGADTYKWFDIDFNRTNNDLEIIPKETDNALKNN